MSEPPVEITTGEWKSEGTYIIWPDETMTFDVNVRRDDSDPYKYYFDALIWDFNGGNCNVYAILSPDGKTLGFPAGQQLDGQSNNQIDKFFSGYDTMAIWNDSPTLPPYDKGYIIQAEYDADKEIITFPTLIACMQHNLYALDEMPEVEWGCMGGFYEGMKLQKVTTSIESIELMGGELTPEYYDITGLRVTSPTKGHIYIVKLGDKVSKLIF